MSRLHVAGRSRPMQLLNMAPNLASKSWNISEWINCCFRDDNHVGISQADIRSKISFFLPWIWYYFQTSIFQMIKFGVKKDNQLFSHLFHKSSKKYLACEFFLCREWPGTMPGQIHLLWISSMNTAKKFRKWSWFLLLFLCLSSWWSTKLRHRNLKCKIWW